MRPLLDENVSPAIGAVLTAAGHDVRLAVDARPGAPDQDVVALAAAEGRVLVTEDNDFGELAFQHGLRPPALVRLALPGALPAEKAARLVEVLASTNPQGVALVVEHTRIRRRPLP